MKNSMGHKLETLNRLEYILVYNILGVCPSGPPPWVVCWGGLYSICVIWGRDYLVVLFIHPSKFFISEEEDDGRRGGG